MAGQSLLVMVTLSSTSCTLAASASTMTVVSSTSPASTYTPSSLMVTSWPLVSERYVAPTRSASCSRSRSVKRSAVSTTPSETIASKVTADVSFAVDRALSVVVSCVVSCSATEVTLVAWSSACALALEDSAARAPPQPAMLAASVEATIAAVSLLMLMYSMVEHLPDVVVIVTGIAYGPKL